MSTKSLRPLIFGVFIPGVFMLLAWWNAVNWPASVRNSDHQAQELETQVFDAGVQFVPPGDIPASEISHCFVVENSTQETWNLAWTGSSCGCTRPTPLTAELKAGERTRITVRIDTQNRESRIQEYAEFSTGAKTTQTVRLLITADVYPVLTFDGLGISGLPVDRSSGTATVTMRVRQPISAPVPELTVGCFSHNGIIHPTSVGTPVTAKMAGYQVTRFPLTIHLLSPRPSLDRPDLPVSGQAHDTAKIVVTSSQLSTEKEFRWFVPEAVSIVPARVYLQVSSAGTATGKVVLSSKGAFTLKDVRFHEADTGLEFQLLDDPGDNGKRVHQITVCAGKAPLSSCEAQFRQATLVISTSHPDQPVVHVPVVVDQRSAVLKLTGG